MSDLESAAVEGLEATEVTESQAEEMRTRSDRCYREIRELLKRHNCTLAAQVQPPEEVGHRGDCVQLRAVPIVIPYVNE